jgi:hypothetical protein
MFTINKILQIPINPVKKQNISMLILEKCEELLKAELRAPIRFSVDYREIKSTDNRFRKFKIISARNQKDK